MGKCYLEKHRTWPLCSCLGLPVWPIFLFTSLPFFSPFLFIWINNDDNIWNNTVLIENCRPSVAIWITWCHLLYMRERNKRKTCLSIQYNIRNIGLQLKWWATCVLCNRLLCNSMHLLSIYIYEHYKQLSSTKEKKLVVVTLTINS